jgi:4'-phosphopantetheinyl transferase
MGSTGRCTIDRPPNAATLPAATCHVWWARPADAPPDWVDVLDAHERARLESLSRSAERQSFLASHALARVVLGAYLGAPPASLRFEALCGTCGGPHGKPRLLGPSDGMQFSLARGGDRVALAVARAPVGVDVEELGRVSASGAAGDLALRPAEAAVLDRMPDERRSAGFLRYWTRKEAVLKAMAVGRAVPPNRLEVSAPDDRPELLDRDPAVGPAGPVQLFDLTPSGGSAACLAVLADAPYHVEMVAGATLLRR